MLCIRDESVESSVVLFLITLGIAINIPFLGLPVIPCLLAGLKKM